MNKFNVPTLLVAVVVCSLITLLTTNLYQPKLNYVNVGEYMSEFEMAKELNRDFEEVFHARQKILDSMSLDLDRMYRSLDRSNEAQTNEYMERREVYLQRKDQFEQRNIELKATYNKQVAQRMNEYVKAYGDANGIDYIYGAQGDGSLLYAKEGHNLTKAIVEYSNTKYSGE